MDSKVIFKDNSAQVKAMMQVKIAQALERIGLLWLQKVTPLVPVDTSTLQKSMKYTVDLSKKIVYVGTNTEYAAYVELGTYKQAAQPYLKPSILNYVGDYESEIRKAIGSGWGIRYQPNLFG